MSNDKLNLHQRLVRVMASMGAIGKGGQATYGDGYAYHKIDDIDDKLRVALIEHGVLAVIVDITDNKLDFYQDPPDRYGKVKTTWHGECKIVVEFINVDNPKDKLQVVGWGQGVDTSDKATGKALSYASKSVYLQALHLRGQPDNEADNIPRTAPKPKSEPKQEPVVTAVMQSWIDALNQCDDIDSFEMLIKNIKADPALSLPLEGWIQQSEVKCWTADINRCQSVEQLSSFAERLRGRPEYLAKPLRIAYATKMKALKS